MATGPEGLGTVRHSRSVGGVAALLMVFVLVLGGPVLTRPDIEGTATALPLPVRPPPGTCLLADGGRLHRLDSCAEPHDAEVIRSWERPVTDGALPGFAAVAAHAPGIDAPAVCLDARRDYVEADVPDRWGIWVPSEPAVVTRLVAAPPGERVGVEGWMACVARTSDGATFRGSVRGGLGSDEIDGRLASCLPSSDGADRSRWITCDEPHHIEVLAAYDFAGGFAADGRWTGPPPADVQLTSCLDLVRALTWTDDITFGGALAVRAEPLQPDLVGVHRPGDTSYSDAGYVALQRPLCFVETTGTARLTDTVVALGRAALPLE